MPRLHLTLEQSLVKLGRQGHLEARRSNETIPLRIVLCCERNPVLTLSIIAVGLIVYASLIQPLLAW